MRNLTRFVAAAALITTLAACSSEEATMSDTPAAAPDTSVQRSASQTPAPANTGTIEARVTYAGAPDVEVLTINKDVEQCGRETRVGTILVGERSGLANAVVSVAGLEGPPAARAAQLDQRGCQFRPHVVAMQPGEIEILNSDGILHNIHTYSEVNPSINKAQPKFKKVMTETFSKPEFIKVTCDVHSWMLGWIAVLPHPYFGVTDASGVTRIEGVPAGSHTIEVWHERLGRRSADVTVTPGATATAVIEFPKAG